MLSEDFDLFLPNRSRKLNQPVSMSSHILISKMFVSKSCKLLRCLSCFFIYLLVFCQSVRPLNISSNSMNICLINKNICHIFPFMRVLKRSLSRVTLLMQLFGTQRTMEQEKRKRNLQIPPYPRTSALLCSTMT